MKTYLASLVLALAHLPASAGTALAENQLLTFATCTGRLSAQMEWEWMFDGPHSEITQKQRARMIELLEAIMPDDRGRDVLSWRIQAKVAHRALLQRATFATDQQDAAWAAAMAERYTADCTAYLLS